MRSILILFFVMFASEYIVCVDDLAPVIRTGNTNGSEPLNKYDENVDHSCLSLCVNYIFCFCIKGKKKEYQGETDKSFIRSPLLEHNHTSHFNRGVEYVSSSSSSAANLSPNAKGTLKIQNLSNMKCPSTELWNWGYKKDDPPYHYRKGSHVFTKEDFIMYGMQKI